MSFWKRAFIVIWFNVISFWIKYFHFNFNIRVSLLRHIVNWPACRAGYIFCRCFFFILNSPVGDQLSQDIPDRSHQIPRIGRRRLWDGLTNHSLFLWLLKGSCRGKFLGTNFRSQIGEIGLSYPPSFIAVTFRIGLEYHNADVRINSDDDLSMLCRNMVRFGPVTPGTAFDNPYSS